MVFNAVIKVCLIFTFIIQYMIVNYTCKYEFTATKNNIRFSTNPIIVLRAVFK